MSTGLGELPADGFETAAARVTARFSLDYTWREDSRVINLYEHAKISTWNASLDLPWDTSVDQEAMARRDAAGRVGLATANLAGSTFERWKEREWLTLAIETQNWTLSQFLHGEQGALLTAGRLVETVPGLDAKFYAAIQTADEARHVEAFARYLDTKLSGHYPVNSHLQAFMRDVLGESRWDITYLGMQVMLEGLALAAFGFLYQLTEEPLLRTLLRYVRADEARHVGYGVAVLSEIYPDLTSAELADRQEFVLEAVVRLRDRLLRQEVWERLEVPSAEACQLLIHSSAHITFQRSLFSKIFGNCDRLGLLDLRGGWLRGRLAEFGFWVPPAALTVGCR